jgi:hypothetical protein
MAYIYCEVCESRVDIACDEDFIVECNYPMCPNKATMYEEEVVKELDFEDNGIYPSYEHIILEDET